MLVFVGVRAKLYDLDVMTDLPTEEKHIAATAFYNGNHRSYIDLRGRSPEEVAEQLKQDILDKMKDLSRRREQ